MLRIAQLWAKEKNNISGVNFLKDKKGVAKGDWMNVRAFTRITCYKREK